MRVFLFQFSTAKYLLITNQYLHGNQSPIIQEQPASIPTERKWICILPNQQRLDNNHHTRQRKLQGLWCDSNIRTPIHHLWSQMWYHGKHHRQCCCWTLQHEDRHTWTFRIIINIRQWYVYTFPGDDNFYLIKTYKLKQLIKDKKYHSERLGGNGSYFNIKLFTKEFFINQCHCVSFNQ